jgi:hypothetical protein
MRRPAVILAFATLAIGPCDMTGPKPPADLSGTWGGINAGMIVDDTSAHIHIGCTFGDIHTRLVLDSTGAFDLPGRHNINAYPVARDITHPARYAGRVSGNEMTLTVTLTDTAVTLGPVRLTYGKEPVMGPCPICKSRADRLRMPRQRR